MSEENNIIKISIQDFAKKMICDGHLFIPCGSRKIYVMKPGILIDSDFVKKYAIKNQIFLFDSVVSDLLLSKFKKQFQILKNLTQENHLRTHCRDVLKLFIESFSGESHFLSFALACYEEFCQIPIENQRKMHETDLYLFRKSLYSSAFSIIISMANDFYHFSMLRDIYNLTFCLDIGLCEKDYSYHIASACNLENKNPGIGLNHLMMVKASDEEKLVYLKHPEKSHFFIKKYLPLNFPELSGLVLYQHELSDGTGFPRGVFKSEVSSWEAVTILSDSLVEISGFLKFEKDVVGYLREFKNTKVNDLPVSKVYKKLIRCFDHIESLLKAS